MRDLFFGLPVQSIGQRPYRSVHEAPLSAAAGRLRLPVLPKARVYGLPLVASHVGADAAAALLAAGLMDGSGCAALMDIGTNTEVIARRGERLAAASCPAGPAFEGGGIACGMPGLEGAVESVRIGASGAVDLEVIGGGAAEGICGSGLVDAIAGLLELGRIDEFGRFTDGSDRFSLDQAKGIYLCERDLSEIAQAKGANVAGMEIVLEALGVRASELDVFYLAGGFGRHLGIASARRIGLIPDLPDDRIRQIGNASIEGVTAVLCSITLRRELERAVRRIEHVELETVPDFFDRFVEGCLYKPVGSSVCNI
jgi:uncharacterized 2Fe-2S/4Fe-4S cluster protein (DUF4445 family)